MLEILAPIVFVLGYLLIALEHNTHIDKAARPSSQVFWFGPWCLGRPW